MSGRPPVVVVHGLDQAVAACRAALRHRRTLALTSGGYLGWALFGALVEAARAAVPAAPIVAAYDPGGRAGPAAEALRRGAEAVIFPPDHPQRPALDALAETVGAVMMAPPDSALDLGWEQDWETALDALLHSPLSDAGEAG